LSAQAAVAAKVSAQPVAVDGEPDAVPLLSVNELRVELSAPGSWGGARRRHVVLDGVSLEAARGQVVGLVGETGSGKSTLGYTILRRYPVTSGSIVFDGQDITTLSGPRARPIRRHVQMVFQDPFSCLPPNMALSDVITEPMVAFGLAPNGRRGAADRRDIAVGLLEECGLPADFHSRTQADLSGGQLQRVAIARAISIKPRLLVADEPTSALDVSIQAQILELLRDLRERRGIAILLISHNLGVIRYLASIVYVLKDGRIVESAPVDKLFSDPGDPYTRELIRSVPEPPMPRSRNPSAEQMPP
jgi:peptide/nickel transport system ATP-binding protein